MKRSLKVESKETDEERKEVYTFSGTRIPSDPRVLSEGSQRCDAEGPPHVTVVRTTVKGGTFGVTD